MTEHIQGPIVGALPPPPGVTPNFVDPPSVQAGTVAVIVVSLTVSTLCVGSRAATGFVNRFANAGWDDCEQLYLAEHPFLLRPFWLCCAYILGRYIFLRLGRTRMLLSWSCQF